MIPRSGGGGQEVNSHKADEVFAEYGVPEPLKVTGSHHFVGLATSKAAHMCATTPEGDLYCWGSNLYGELGHDPSSLEISMSPLLVPLG